LFAVAALFTGCASKPKDTAVSLDLVAAADANPDARGRASPLRVRVYGLKTPGAFNEADFFSLFDKESATLGTDLVQREEVLLRPGESKQLSLKLSPDVKVIGVIAAYRDLDRAHWRELNPLKVSQSNKLEARFGARQIQVVAR
jgi:type VI secretion system protein VasD